MSEASHLLNNFCFALWLHHDVVISSCQLILAYSCMYICKHQCCLGGGLLLLCWLPSSINFSLCITLMNKFLIRCFPSRKETADSSWMKVKGPLKYGDPKFWSARTRSYNPQFYIHKWAFPAKPMQGGDRHSLYECSLSLSLPLSCHRDVTMAEAHLCWWWFLTLNLAIS